MHTSPSQPTFIPHRSAFEHLFESTIEREMRLKEAVAGARDGALRRVLLKAWWQSQDQVERLQAVHPTQVFEQSYVRRPTRAMCGDEVEALLKAEQRLLDLCDTSLAVLPANIRPTVTVQREELAVSIKRLAAFRLLIN